VITVSEFEKRLNEINVWRHGDTRAVSKPLLLLYALGKCSRKEGRLIQYSEIDVKLKQLLTDFGPHRQLYHPEYPFWRLQKDGLWEVVTSENLGENRSGDVSRMKLLQGSTSGGFPLEVFELLQENRQFLNKSVMLILESHFPESLHEDILTSIGFDFDDKEVQLKTKRSAAFREKILRAYQYRCAICGFDLRLENISLALEAAHIKWHQAGGPDEENNGMALCVLHHKVFDRGAITVSSEQKVIVSQAVNGNIGHDWVSSFHGKTIFKAQCESYFPKDRFLAWHCREVFKHPGRP